MFFLACSEENKSSGPIYVPPNQEEKSKEEVKFYSIQDLDKKSNIDFILGYDRILILDSISGINLKAKNAAIIRNYFQKNLIIRRAITLTKNSFQIENKTGNAIWTIETKKEKILLYNASNLENPYEIKKENQNKSQLFKANINLGEIIFNPTKNEINIQSESKNFKLDTKEYSPIFAVLLIEEMSKKDQYITICETIKNGTPNP